MSKVTVWAGYGEVDKDEGRRGSYVVGYYHRPQDAEKAVEKAGVWNMPGRTGPVEGYIFEDEGVEYFVAKEHAKPIE